MTNSLQIEIGDLMPQKGRSSINPANHPDEEFELLSIPAYDKGAPEIAFGRDIGSTKQVVQEEDVLLSKIVPHIRRAWVVDPPKNSRQIASSEWIVFRSNNVDARYLRHFLISDAFHRQFMQTVSGVGGSLLRARPKYVAKIKIPLPPMEEQRRIAAILDKASKINTLIAEAIRKVADMKDSLFDEMFVADGLHDNWEHVALGDLCDVQGGLQVSSKRSSMPIKVPYLRVANVLRGRLLLDEIKEIKCSQSELERTSLQSGDLLIVEGHGNPSEIGRVAMWAKYPGEIVHQNHLIRARSQNDSLDPNFLCFYLNSRTGRRHLLKRANTTSGLNTISTSVVKSSPIILPPTTLQKQFCNAIKSITQLEANIINKQSVHQKLTASLASELFKK